MRNPARNGHGLWRDGCGLLWVNTAAAQHFSWLNAWTRWTLVIVADGSNRLPKLNTRVRIPPSAPLRLVVTRPFLVYALYLFPQVGASFLSDQGFMQSLSFGNSIPSFSRWRCAYLLLGGVRRTETCSSLVPVHGIVALGIVLIAG